MSKLKITAVALLLSAMTGLHAEGSYLGFGLGLTFNLAQLGGTITNDGLDSSNPEIVVPKDDKTCVLTATCPVDPESNGVQQIIIPENKLISLEKSVPGLFKSKTSGPMNGLTGNIYWESEQNGWFWRVGVSHTRKVMGGYTHSKVAGFKWYDITWDFDSTSIPAYIGLKTGVGETASVYMGAGINYSSGGFELSGSNLGFIPGILGFPQGMVGVANTADGYNHTGAFATAITASAVSASSGSFMAQKIDLRTYGRGFNIVTGIEKKLDSGNKVYFEIESIFAGGYGHQAVKSSALLQGLAPVPAKIVVLGGTSYSFGYKMAM